MLQQRPTTLSDAAPAGVRHTVWVVAALVGLGAIYLIAVRGEAILVDLSQLAGKVWCF